MSDIRSDVLFDALVDSVGVKAFAANLGVSSRQIHRMLSGTQPNPVRRLRDALASGDGMVSMTVLDYLCQEHDGHFVPVNADIEVANLNAVKEAAEAILVALERRLHES